jgi:hypothetical protein
VSPRDIVDLALQLRERLLGLVVRRLQVSRSRRGSPVSGSVPA